MRRRKKYDEGDWFAVPLEGGGFGVGLAARAGGRSGIAFGYFFGPKRDEPPSAEELSALTPDRAVLSGRFADHSLRHGEWPRIGTREPWNRNDWPMPAFMTGSEVPGTPAWRVVVSDDDPNKELETVEISDGEKEGLLPDVVYGEESVEARLTELLDPDATRDAPDDRAADGTAEALFYLYFASRDAARDAARDLEAESYEVRVEGPLDEPPELPFLVLATRRFDVETVDDDVDAAEKLMERVAGSHDGDYDGLEREVV